MPYPNAGICFKYVPNKWYNACARRQLRTKNGRAETCGGRKTYDFATWCRHEKPCENPLPAFKLDSQKPEEQDTLGPWKLPTRCRYAEWSQDRLEVTTSLHNSPVLRR
ncbi:Hypothetical predicted protein [Pelobates cultripes]|uniref:Uncharacterized protein n=1 Tax=Pelobates cultripes TaxID=61616 RepID=A0AAD1R8M7_PELCU|nr:Hypothetical predicted protein [Pelobates cultripes]